MSTAQAMAELTCDWVEYMRGEGQSNPDSTHLDMRYMGINSKGAYNILKHGVPLLTNLKSLDLRHNDLSGVDCSNNICKGLEESLVDGLHCTPKLDELNLDTDVRKAVGQDIGKQLSRINASRSAVRAWASLLGEDVYTSFNLANSGRDRVPRSLHSPWTRLTFFAKACLLLADAVFDLILITVYAEQRHWGWFALMLALYCLPSVIFFVEEMPTFGLQDACGRGLTTVVCRFARTSALAFLNLTQLGTIWWTIQSLCQGSEIESLIRSSNRQVVFESIPQAWVQFYIFLRESQMSCTTQPECVLPKLWLLLAVSFMLSNASAARELTQFQSTCIENSPKTWFDGPLLFCEISARMLTIGMLGILFRGWPAFVVVFVMFLMRIILLFHGSAQILPRPAISWSVILLNAAQCLISAQFCFQVRLTYRMCVILTCLEGIITALLFEYHIHLQKHVQIACWGAWILCGTVSFIGRLVSGPPKRRRQGSLVATASLSQPDSTPSN